ncbi:MAG TPA: cyclase, partial [Archangium sp.]|nr:cyclase [Archangium sp.]
LEAAEAVLMFPPGGPDVMEIIHSLRSKSLLRAYAPDGLPGELRLGLYESIRQYASSRLAERGEGGELAFRRLSLERENLLAACDNALAVVPATEGSLERALGALVALEPDVTARGPVGITLSRLDRALELSSTVRVEPLLRAEALAVRGRTHHGAGQLAAAWRDLEVARSAFHALDAMDRAKRVLVDLSIVARDEGDMGTAWELVQEAQELPSLGDRWLDAYAVGNLGILELGRRGAGAAVPHLRTALELFRDVGDVAFEVGFLTNYAMAIGEGGGTAEAVSLLEEAMEKASRVGDRAGHALARVNLGCFLLDAGRAAEAREHLEGAVRMGRQLGMRILEGVALGELGRALVALGALEGARACLSESISILDRVSRWHALRFTAHLASVQAALGELAAARDGFASLEVTPELRDDTVLRELSSLLRASLDLAEAARSAPGSEAGMKCLSEARRRVEQARGAPAEAASSDLREALRLLGRSVLSAYGDTAQA